MNSEKAQEKIKNLSEKFDEITATHAAVSSSQRRHKPGPTPKKRKKSAGKIVLGVIIFFLMLGLVGVGTLFFMINSGKKNLLDYEDTVV